MMTEELLKALQTIKEECEKYDNCDDGYPMCNFNGDCGVRKTNPENWRLKKREVYF